MNISAEAVGWDRQYESGRYDNEPPIPFVNQIIDELGEAGKKQSGLYVGCGNGRNYIPLVQSGLDLRGIDISAVGVNQIIDKYPAAAGKVWQQSFEDLTSARVFDYLVAIQVFQHGDEQKIHKYFRNSVDALKPGGKLFLRVNSTSTQIKHRHQVVEQNEHGGFTVIYEEGPKAGVEIHFFSKIELERIADSNKFNIIKPLVDVIEPRHIHADGVWAQWEGIWQKKSDAQ